MKGRTLSILGIFAAVAGAILILCFNSISVKGITITGGILFMAVGLINLLFFSSISRNENSSGRVLTLITNAAAIILGLCMLVFMDMFSPLIPFIFGLFVAVCALWQFFVLAVGTRPFQLPVWLYIFPLLLSGGAVFIFINRTSNEDALIMMATGISLAVMGLACIIEGSALGMARRTHEHEQRQATTQATAQAQPAAAPAPAPQQPANSTETTPAAPTHRTVETTDDLDDEVAD